MPNDLELFQIKQEFVKRLTALSIISYENECETRKNAFQGGS